MYKNYVREFYDGVGIECSSEWVRDIIKDSFWILDFIDKDMLNTVVFNDYVELSKRKYGVSVYLKTGYHFNAKENLTSNIDVVHQNGDEKEKKTFEVKTYISKGTVTCDVEFPDDRTEIKYGYLSFEQDKYDEIFIRHLFENSIGYIIKNKPQYIAQEEFDLEVESISRMRATTNLDDMKDKIKYMDEILNDDKYAECENKEIIIKQKEKIAKAISLKENGMQRRFEERKEYQFIYRYFKDGKVMYVGQTSGDREDGWKSRHSSHMGEPLPYKKCDYIEVARVENASTKDIYERYYINKPDENGDLPLWNVSGAGLATTLVLPELNFKKYRIKDLKQL